MDRDADCFSLFATQRTLKRTHVLVWVEKARTYLAYPE